MYSLVSITHGLVYCWVKTKCGNQWRKSSELSPDDRVVIFTPDPTITDFEKYKQLINNA